MKPSKHSDSHDRTNEIEAPVPTIVGPRPEGISGATISVPRGLENLLTLAAMNEDWKDKTLADPIRAAAEAEIQLSPSESAILRTIPAQTLGQMILSMFRTRLAPIRDTALAVGTASAALLAATDVLGEEMPSRGIRPDIPPEPAKPAVPAAGQIKWEASLVMALKQAAASKRAVMVVCPYGAEKVSRRTGPPGSLGILVELPKSRLLQELCNDGNPAVAAAVATAKLIAVKPPDEAGSTPDSVPARKEYVAMLKKYGVADDAPLVFFLAPDGTVLHREQPTDERKIVRAVETVPVLLAKWLTAQQPPVDPAPPATKGHTKD
jgi:hypothetical protein